MDPKPNPRAFDDLLLYGDPEQPASEPELPGVSALVRRRFLTLALFVLGAVAAALYYCSRASIVYESTAQILVMQRATPVEVSAVVTSVDERVAKDLLATHMQIIGSRKIVERALEKDDLGALASVQAALEEGTDPAGYVLDRLTVAWGGKGQAQSAQVLTLSLKHTDPEDCARILSAVVESYEAFVQEKFHDAGLEAAALIGRAKDELSDELARKEADYRRLREETPLLWANDEGVNVHQVRLRDIERSLSELRVQHEELKSRVEIVRSVVDGGAPGAGDLERLAAISAADTERLAFLVDVERMALQPANENRASTVEALRALEPAEYERLPELRLEAKRLESEMGPDSRQSTVVRELIAELERFLAEKKAGLLVSAEPASVQPSELMQAYLRLLSHDLADMERRKAALQDLADQEQANLQAMAAFELQEESLQRDIERAQTLFASVVQRLQEINLLKDYGALITETISPVAPGTQVWPNRLLLVACGGFVGLFLGAAMALLLEMRDRRFRGAQDIRRSLRLDVLASIPKLKAVRRRSRRNGSRVDARLLTFHQPDSPAAESFRHLRTSLYFGGLSGPCKVLQVSSPRAGDGKTTLVANLAVSIAQTGKRVLVIDADLRRPSLHEMFAVDGTKGLSSCLSGEVALDDAIRSTDCENLFLLPAGAASAMPSELLSGPRFEELIEHAREQYDFVLVDSPPLLGPSDARVVAARCDGVLLQVRITRKGRPEAVAARSMLDRLGATVVGAAVRGAKRNGIEGAYA